MPRMGPSMLAGALALLIAAPVTQASYPGSNGYLVGLSQIMDTSDANVSNWTVSPWFVTPPTTFESDGWHVVHPGIFVGPFGSHFNISRTDVGQGLAPGPAQTELIATAFTHVDFAHRHPSQGLIWVTQDDDIFTEFGDNILSAGPACLHYYFPRWSPDGNLIAYYCKAPLILGGSVLQTDLPDASNSDNISNWPTSGGLSGFDWSPTGSRLVYAGTSVLNGADTIWTNNTTGSDEQEVYVADCDHCLRGIAWSPDGTKIAFGLNEPGVDRTIVMDADGTNLHATGMVSSPYLDWGRGDTGDPSVFLLTQPANPSNSSSAHFGFFGIDLESGLDHAECSLDGAAFTTCDTLGGQTYTGLPDGAHTFDVIMVDLFGNQSSAASYAWTIDTDPPTVTITRPEEGGRYSFYKDVVPIYSCGGPGLVSCVPSANPIDRSTLGPRTFSVTATDTAGNQTTVTRHYTIFTFAGLILDDHPIWYFRLGDPAGSQTMAALAGPDGEYKNGQDSEPFGVTGDHDAARSFLGRDGYGYANGVSAPPGQFTMAAFVRPDTSNDGVIMQHGGGGALWVEGGVFHFRPVAGRPGEVSGGPVLTPGTWHLVAGVYDGGRYARLYVDGALVATARASGRASGASTFYLGRGDFSDWFHGAIDEPAYFPSALSATHIFEIWLADPPPDGPAPAHGHRALGARSLVLALSAGRAGRLTGRILRNGHVVARVVAHVRRGDRRVRLTPSRALAAGRYRLTYRIGHGRLVSVRVRVG